MSFALFLAKMCTLVLAKSFALSLPKICTSFSDSPLEWRWVHTSVAGKFVALFETVRILRRFCQMAWQGNEAPKQTIEFPAAPSFFSSKKWIKLIPKTIRNRKRDCAWGCARGIKHHLRKSADRKAQIRTDLCFSICKFSQVVFTDLCFSICRFSYALLTIRRRPVTWVYLDLGISQTVLFNTPPRQDPHWGYFSHLWS